MIAPRALAPVLGAACALAAATPCAGAPSVVASIVPVHSLIAGVMRGVGEPRLVVRGAGSPHTWQMRPSDAAALEAADVVFWVGEALETFLARPIANLGGRARIVAFSEIEGVRRLPNREGGVWTGDGAGAHAHAGAAEHGAHAAARFDAHLWLDADNAARLVDAAAGVLAGVDPANAAAYRRNAAALSARIAALDAALAARLAPVRDVPYVVFHDAYQYVERRYATNPVGAITVHPQRPPGARRLVELRDRIVAVGAACVFREPQFEPELVRTVLEGTGARAAVLDPLGAAIEPGPDAWFDLMASIGASMAGCLGGG